MEKIKTRPVAVAAYIRKEGKGLFALHIGKGLQLPVLHGQYSDYTETERVARRMGASMVLRVD